jgi:hypothetical protein
MDPSFVVRLGPNTEPALWRFEGRVEEVDTGADLRFRSTEELLRFLGQHFDEAFRRQHRPDPRVRLKAARVRSPGESEEVDSLVR